MTALFRIETDRAVLVWRASRSGTPTAIAGAAIPPGVLRVEGRRPAQALRVLRRASETDEVHEGHRTSDGPRLFEQTDYAVYVRARADARVTVAHADPVLLRGLCTEDGGRVLHGSINFGSHVGRSGFTLLVGGQPEVDFEVEVFPSKLDYAGDYEALLADVQDIAAALALAYLRPTQRAGGDRLSGHVTALEWVALLRLGCEQLEHALDRIAARPSTRLAPEASTARAEQVRRTDATLRTAVLRGQGRGGLVRVDERLVVREHLPERRSRPASDSAENRWLAAQIRQIRHRVGELAGRTSDLPTGGRRDRAVEELRTMERRLTVLLNREPLTDVRSDPPAGFTSPQLLGAPGYAEAYRACLLLSRGAHLQGGPLELSLKDIATLYEYWCYLTVVRAIADATGRDLPASDLLTVHEQGLRVRLERGHASRSRFETAGGRAVTVEYNPRFDGAGVLVPQQPDILVTIERERGRLLRLIVDAKYRVDASPEYIARYGIPGPPEDALNTLHRYRDALSVYDGKRARCTWKAAAVYPYRESRSGQFARSRLWRSLAHAGVGAIAALPGSTTHLTTWLESALEE